MKARVRNNTRGFTLVELITVLVVLTVLAALLIPALTGYIDQAKQKKVIAEARDVWTASQAAMSECYGLYPESFEESCKFSTMINGEWVTHLGRITNGALGALQRNPKDPTEVNTSSRRIARQVLIYLESAGKKNPRYDFGIEKTRYEPSGQKLNDYLGEKPKANEVAIQIFHTSDGRVVAIDFGKDGYVVTIVAGEEIVCKKNGTFLPSRG